MGCGFVCGTDVSGLGVRLSAPRRERERERERERKRERKREKERARERVCVRVRETLFKNNVHDRGYVAVGESACVWTLGDCTSELQ